MAFRHELVFETLTVASPEVRDTAGNPVEEWTESFRALGSVESMGSREIVLGGRVYQETMARFIIRDSSVALNPARYRIVFGGKNYNIAAPRPIEFNDGNTFRRSVDSRRPYLAIDGWVRD